MEGFHGRKPSLDAHGFIHVILEGFVQRVNRPAYASTRECLDEIQVAEHQVALRGYREFDATALKLFQQSPGTAILLLFWQIRVGNRAKEKLLAAQRTGMKTVLLPDDNRKDLDDVPKEIVDSLDIRFISEADEALTSALDATEQEIFSGEKSEAFLHSLRMHKPLGGDLSGAVL
jgi:hypothetical protein